MRISYDIAHWLCLLGGIALVLTGFTAKTMLHGSHTVAGTDTRHSHTQIMGQRAMLVLLGLGVIAYSLTRLVY
jgi:hypothetical protein